MADASDIQVVIDNIEAGYEEHGWSETAISDRLDSGAIPERVITAYWRTRANTALYLVNTSESGSSRGNDVVYSRMKTLADEWDAKALAIEVPVTIDSGRGRISSFPIKRV
jgi:hypothetical protein